MLRPSRLIASVLVLSVSVAAIIGTRDMIRRFSGYTGNNTVTATVQSTQTKTAPMQSTQANTANQTQAPSAGKAPASPTGLRLTSVKHNAVSLSWQSVHGDVQYDIYRSTSNYYQKAQRIGHTTDTRYTDKTVKANALYFYWVVAQTVTGKSTPKQAARARTPYSWKTIRDMNQGAVVKIKTYASNWGALAPNDVYYGTGFFIDGGKYIVTCWHVVRDKHYVLDVYPYLGGKNYNDNTWYHAKVVKVNKAHDLALIQVYQKGGGNAKTNWKAPAVQLGAGVTAGQSLGVLGHPGGEAMTMTTGTVEQASITEPVQKIGTLHGQIAMNLPTVGGNSGSPVFNHNGRVVGVLESGANGNGNQSYAVPITALKAWGYAGHNDLTSKVEKIIGG